MHEIDSPDRGEFDALLELDAQAFGRRMPPAIVSLVERDFVPDRVVVSRDGGELVGSAVSLPSAGTLPGLTRTPVAMVVGVAVAPTHRRQGRLTSLMRAQLDDLRRRGETVAMLFASEGGIYGRFGYGMATFGARYSIERRTARLRPEDGRGGRVRFIDREVAKETVPAVYAAYAPTRAGELDRTEIDFADAFGLFDPVEDAKGRFFAVYEDGGRVDGYVSYSVGPVNPALGRDPRAVFLDELCALSPAAYAALWRFLLGIDLVSEIRTHGRPIDEPVRWLLEDSRQLRTTSIGDRTWVRLVDAPAALAVRRYPAAGSLVIELHDEFCPWNDGSLRLEVSKPWGEPVVEPVQSPGAGAPTVVLDASVLASLYLGGVSASQFAAVGRIDGGSEAIGLAEAMFANDRPPFTSTDF